MNRERIQLMGNTYAELLEIVLDTNKNQLSNIEWISILTDVIKQLVWIEINK